MACANLLRFVSSTCYFLYVTISFSFKGGYNKSISTLSRGLFRWMEGGKEEEEEEENLTGFFFVIVKISPESSTS